MENIKNTIKKVISAVKGRFINWWVEIRRDTKQMIVFGPARAGKTTWFEYLRTGKIKEVEATIGPDKIESFDFKRSDGSIIRIKETIDVPGEIYYLDKDLLPKIKSDESKVIFYFFSGVEFLKNEKVLDSISYKYREYVVRELEYIYTKSGKNTQIYVILTFANKIEDPIDVLKQLYNMVRLSVEGVNFNGYWNYLNMKDEDQMQNFKNKLKL